MRKVKTFVVWMEDDRDCVEVYLAQSHKDLVGYLNKQLNTDEDQPTFDVEQVYHIEEVKSLTVV